MPRLRTIQQAYTLIKFEDPDTIITEYFLRKLVMEGKIPSIRSGKKFMIDVDAVSDYLSRKTAIK